MSIYWHDYETFGANPRWDRPSQFAGIRTDEELNVVGDPLVLYCRPADDFLPEPGACLVTGITPQLAAAEGIPERTFCERILTEFSQPNTCVAGYNSIRFDDEVSRYLLYRCLQEPYAREWQHGNSRWDLLDVLRLAHAVRPEGIHWPRREDGHTSFRLEHLTEANDIGHEDAHDALSDVMATIGMARLLRQAQPKLYDYAFGLRDKRRVGDLLEPEQREPVLHVSGMLPAERGHIGVVIPLLRDPVNRNAVHVFDLCEDPGDWLGMSGAEIRERLYTPTAELAEGESRIALKTIHLNRCPMVAPLSVLDAASQKRWGIDPGRCRAHLEKLEAVSDLEERLQVVYAPREHPERPGDDDPDGMLYSGGFFSDRDRGQMLQLQSLTGAELASTRPDFQDQRLPELLFRLRARNHPDSLSPEEQQRWRTFRRERLTRDDAPWLTWKRFWDELDAARETHPDRSDILDPLADWATALGRELELAR